MKVLYVVTLFPCWSETFIVREIEALRRRGVEVRIVSLKPPHETLVHADAQALLSRTLYAPPGVRALGRALREALRTPRATFAVLARTLAALWRRPTELAKSLASYLRALAVAPAVREFGPEHIHSHWATYGSSAAWLLGRALDVPFSFTAHAHDIFVHDHMLGAKLRQSAFAVTISEYNRRLLLGRFGPAAVSRLHVVHCGVRTQEFVAGAVATRPRMLSVGRFDPKKGFDVLVEACALLRDRGVAFECEIIGEGPGRAVLERQIASLDLARQLSLPGAAPQERVRAAMLESALFVLPCVEAADGDMDGIPVALMEAMASGLPVVSTAVSGVPELVVDGRTGLLVPPRDAPALADALQRLLATPELARALGREARDFVAAAFDADREGARLHALIGIGCTERAPRGRSAPEAA